MSEKKRQRRKEARPDEILDAALKEFGSKGFGGASIGSIAARAGIARATVYLYFKTKDEIFEAAMNDRMGSTIDAAQRIVASDLAFEDMLERLLQNYYQRIVGTDATVLLRVLISEGGRFPALVNLFETNLLTCAEQMLRQLVEKGVASGEVRESALDLDCKVIIAPAVFAAIWSLIFVGKTELDKEKYIRSHVSVLLNGLRSLG